MVSVIFLALGKRQICDHALHREGIVTDCLRTGREVLTICRINNLSFVDGFPFLCLDAVHVCEIVVDQAIVSCCVVKVEVIAYVKFQVVEGVHIVLGVKYPYVCLGYEIVRNVKMKGKLLFFIITDYIDH